MYYLMSYAFIFFLSIVIVLVYDGTAPYGFILAFICIAVVLHSGAAYYAMSKYNALEDRIKKLENKREDE